MTVDEAIAGCSFWTETESETQMWGSSTDKQIADFFGCNVSAPMERWTKPDGARCYDIRISRWLITYDPDDPLKPLRDEKGVYVMRENEIYTKIRAEIARRKAEGKPG